MDNHWLRILQNVLSMRRACFAVGSAVWLRLHDVRDGSTQPANLKGRHMMQRCSKSTPVHVGRPGGSEIPCSPKCTPVVNTFSCQVFFLRLSFPWLFSYLTFKNLRLHTGKHSTVTEVILRKPGRWRNRPFLKYIHDSIKRLKFWNNNEI